MKAQSRVLRIVHRLKQEYGEPKTTLQYSNPLELLIATILSAQCTDDRVNQVTGPLFKKYQVAKDYAEADLAELELAIKPTGFYRNKAKYIKNACRMIVEKFHSNVPDNMEDLLQLPGVARKTANIVLSNAFGVVAGIAVDTHVRRLSRRLGLTHNKVLDKIERDLMTLVPCEEWLSFTYLLIEHGRAICKARKPLCMKCVLGRELCPSYSSFN